MSATRTRAVNDARYLLFALATACGSERDKRMAGRCDEVRLARLERVLVRARARYLRRLARADEGTP